MSHFYLTHLLKSALVKSTMKKIVIVSAEAHRFASIDQKTDLKPHLVIIAPFYLEDILKKCSGDMNYGHLNNWNIQTPKFQSFRAIPFTNRTFKSGSINLALSTFLKYIFWSKFLFLPLSLSYSTYFEMYFEVQHVLIPLQP